MDKKEINYELGIRQTTINMMLFCLKNLSNDDPFKMSVNYLIEREQAINTLRQVCERFGDNDWEEDFYLAEIIDKHLWRNLEDNTKENSDPKIFNTKGEFFEWWNNLRLKNGFLVLSKKDKNIIKQLIYEYRKNYE